MKTYHGHPSAARGYVEAGRTRADEYYLVEDSGIAQHYEASPERGVRELAPLTGDQYEAWVAGFDPAIGAPKGYLRHDERAVRFVEIVVNGPKSWSLAAALHDDISAAYDAAQDTAARQIIAWLSEHATTRVGPRGNQIQVPVEALEAAVIRHHSSRAGDPHRHLHLQINARVLAEGRWRGLHTVGVRDALDALNGIGHAAVMTDPGFRVALARHGFTLDPDSGEIDQLAHLVGPFSARAAQIGRNLDRYEADWRTTNPGREPGPRLRQAWDRRAWADARPDKIVPRTGAEMTNEWVAELRDLGYRDPDRPAEIDAVSVGSIDRDTAVTDMLTRLGAHRSAWNAADVRGQVEQLIARHNIVTDPAVRTELAEDLTARALAECVPLLDRDGLPEHLRALTSRHVLLVEADLTTRLTARAATRLTPGLTPGLTVFSTPRDHARPDLAFDVIEELDMAQREIVGALASDAPLVVVEGAAGAGKTTTLAAARAALGHSGQRLIVVTPSRRAARVASGQVGADASSAAWLVHQHGYRWSDTSGAWTRLTAGQTDPVTSTTYTGPSDHATLRTGDVLLVDEAGMLDQDSARALLTIADEAGARVALVGDRHQLPAIGRGGVLELAARYAAPESCLTLDTIHRFSDPDYARLSLAMRTGEDPDSVFDTLLHTDQIRVHASEVERRQAIATQATEAITSGESSVWLADTREEVNELNAAIRDRLVAAGRVDDRHTVATAAGQRLGLGDRVATRRNDPNLRVANRDLWTITAIHADGTVTVTGEPGTRTLTGAYRYEHLELAYATTVHGAQGQTVTAAHLLVSEHTTAAAAYVGMTRGQQHNTAHLVAESTDTARDQWAAAFTRARADLGPTHATHVAEREAARYTPLRPLEEAMHDLREAWTVQADTEVRLARAEKIRTELAHVVQLREQRKTAVPPLAQNDAAARDAARQASAAAEQAETVVTAHAASIAASLHRAWDAQLGPARAAAETVRAGSGLLAHRRRAVRDASEHLAHWSASWQPYLPAMPTRLEDVVRVVDWHDDNLGVPAAFTEHARAAAEQAHPETAEARTAADQARQHAEHASRVHHDVERRYDRALARYGRLAMIDNPDAALTELDQQLPSLRADTDHARDQLGHILADPTLRTQPRQRIATEHARWQAQRRAEQADHTIHPARRPTETWTPPAPDHSHSISR